MIKNLFLIVITANLVSFLLLIMLSLFEGIIPILFLIDIVFLLLIVLELNVRGLNKNAKKS